MNPELSTTVQKCQRTSTEVKAWSGTDCLTGEHCLVDQGTSQGATSVNRLVPHRLSLKDWYCADWYSIDWDYTDWYCKTGSVQTGTVRLVLCRLVLHRLVLHRPVPHRLMPNRLAL